ncbi:MAG: NAD(P)-dependent oxidoreductase [Candidatus Latescibacterota bacterium]|nr:NAD(P)-dependent oxidoreductase [Candidatus Latescibacterota bacterium]
MKLVVTGASGYVAGRMLDALRERYELTLLDVKTTNREGQHVDGILVSDLLNEDRKTFRANFTGADAVLHCAFTRSDIPDGQFFAEHANVKMAYNVYQTCIEEGVKRVVVISSNHAADYYENLIWSDRMEYVTPEMVPLSDNFYGWAKASYELLGFAFATGNVTNGRQLEVIQLRVGGPRETDIDRVGPDDLKKMHRALGAYLSVRDQVQLVVKSLETKNVNDENGVPFQIFYGISGNSHNFWSLSNAKRVIGYAPEDNSAIKFADKIATVLEQAKIMNYEC